MNQLGYHTYLAMFCTDMNGLRIGARIIPLPTRDPDTDSKKDLEAWRLNQRGQI